MLLERKGESLPVANWEYKLFSLHEWCISISFLFWSSDTSHTIKDGESATSTLLVGIFSIAYSNLPEFVSLFVQNRLKSGFLIVK